VGTIVTGPPGYGGDDRPDLHGGPMAFRFSFIAALLCILPPLAARAADAEYDLIVRNGQIGRASCRERV